MKASWLTPPELARRTAATGLGGQGDHVPVAAEHVRQRGADRVQRPFQVHVEHLVEMLARELEERAVGADARVRDDDVDAAEYPGRGVAQARERVEVPDVARLRHCAGQPEVVAAP